MKMQSFPKGFERAALFRSQLVKANLVKISNGSKWNLVICYLVQLMANGGNGLNLDLVPNVQIRPKLERELVMAHFIR